MSILHSGEFLDYYNNIIRVTFYDDSNKLNKTADLTFAGKMPVVINRSGDTNEIFAPLKSSNCDITIVSKHILSDLYTTDKKAIKVKVEKISKTNTVRLFEGYMTPNTYSQHLSPNLDSIDMTAIDPISLLKYIYVDEILEKAKTISIGDVIAKALNAVKIDGNELQIEDVVDYQGGKLKDLLIQTYNFWDEGDEPMSVYDAVSECLRLFGYVLSFTGEKYIIYNSITDHTANTTRKFIRYKLEDSGVLSVIGEISYNTSDYLFSYISGEWTAIDDNPTISIEDSYNRITGVASTRIPDLSNSAFDLIDAEDRDKYDAADVNIARNKTKGYGYDANDTTTLKLITDDEWYYIWNGVYISPEFGLEITGNVVNGFANINAAYTYMTGQTGNPAAYGGILNFYGSEDNPSGNDRDPDENEERSVDIKRCITVFAPDNGVPPEFLERSDLSWDYRGNLPSPDDENPDNIGAEIFKNDIYTNIQQTILNPRWGVSKEGIADAVSYKQKFENINITDGTEQNITIDISQGYSRTGIKDNIEISNYSIIENKYFQLIPDGENEDTYSAALSSGEVFYYPPQWNSENLTVKKGYFDRFRNGDNMYVVWDKRKIYLYITMLDGTKYQFNGKEWVNVTAVSDANAFYLLKLMNNEKIFKGEFQYNIIECSDGERYSFNEDGFKTSSYDNISFDKKGTYSYYADINNTWAENVEDVGEGRMSIRLPKISGININVDCEIYHSSLLGITGNKTNNMPNNLSHTVYYKVEGKYTYRDDNGDIQEGNLSSYNTSNYGAIVGSSVRNNEFGGSFMPVNATYVKAEHLDIDISISVPESNLGQMFGESDIKYQTASAQRFRESFDCPEFLVNTKHQIVAVSNSYVIYNNAFADPNLFKINNLYSRPENYVIQGYKNYWSVIRKIYNRVLVPNKEGFSNIMCYVEAPDIPNDGNGRWLVVVSDSNDVKTNRHTITAVEDYSMKVNSINNYTVIEIPRKSRNPRYDLPSVEKK